MLRFAALVAFVAAQGNTDIDIKTNTASGGVCETGNECQRSEYCDFFSDCRPRKSQGEYCTGDQPGDQLCEETLICDQRDHQCVLPVPKCGNDTSCFNGEYCDTQGTKTCYPVACNSDVQCSPRYFCHLTNGTRAGNCTRQAQQGQQCALNFPCTQGLRCQSGICVAAPTPAAAPPQARGNRVAGLNCTRELDCQIGLYCKNGDPRYRNRGICTLWSQEGQQCDESTLCDQGLFCVVQSNYGDEGLCIPYQESGYAKIRPGSTRWVQDGRPIARSRPNFGMQDAGSVPQYANGKAPYLTLAPSSPPTHKVRKNPPKNVPATPPSPTSYTSSSPFPRPVINIPASSSSSSSPFFPSPSSSSSSSSPFFPSSSSSSLPLSSFPSASSSSSSSSLSSSSSIPFGVNVPLPSPVLISPSSSLPSISQIAAVQPVAPQSSQPLIPVPTPSPPCCDAVNAVCLSCKLRISLTAFCTSNPTVSGCSGGLSSVASSSTVRTPASAPVQFPVAASFSAPALAAPSLPTATTTSVFTPPLAQLAASQNVRANPVLPAFQSTVSLLPVFQQPQFIQPQQQFIQPQPVLATGFSG